MERPPVADHALASSLAELFPEPVLLVEEVAERLRISTRTVIRAIDAGRLLSLKGSVGCHRVLRGSIIEWLATEHRSAA